MNPPPTCTNWYYSRDGKATEGPAPLDEIHTMITTGVLSPRSLVVAVGENVWKSVEETFPEILPPAGPSALPPRLPASAPVSVPAVQAASPPSAPAISDHQFPAPKSWFARLSPLRKAAVVVGGGFLALILLGLAGGGGGKAPAPQTPSQVSSQPSEGISREEEELLLRMAEASVPKNRYSCPECGGSGQRDNTGSFRSTREHCGTCSGRGTIRTQSGFETTCPTCSGLGSPKTLPCHKCGGSGQVWGY
jgi:hypothetical protein